MRKVQLSYKVCFVFEEANIGKGIYFFKKKKKSKILKAKTLERLEENTTECDSTWFLDGRMMIESLPTPDFFKFWLFQRWYGDNLIIFIL